MQLGWSGVEVAGSSTTGLGWYPCCRIQPAIRLTLFSEEANYGIKYPTCLVHGMNE